MRTIGLSATSWYVGTPWYEVKASHVAEYWVLRDRMANAAMDWKQSGGQEADGYTGEVFTPILTIQTYHQYGDGKSAIGDIRVVVLGPPPGACPTLVKMIFEALAMHVAGEVKVGTEPIERGPRSGPIIRS